MRIAIAVVTYNRLEKLQRLIKSVPAQYQKDIYFFDNASTDATAEFLQKKFSKRQVFRSKKNVGGSGGFHELVRRLYTQYDALYLCDDDVVFTPSTLSTLIQAAEKLSSWSFLISTVFEYQYKSSIPPVNMPVLKHVPPQELLRYLSLYSCVPTVTGSFVGFLLNTAVVNQVGLPYHDFFIYGDDYEYSLRISSTLGECYLCTESILYHDTDVTATSVPAWKYYYASRNLFFTYRKHRNLLLYFGDRSILMLSLALKGEWRNMLAVVKGMLAGILFHPER